jgi:hypothetical protein
VSAGSVMCVSTSMTSNRSNNVIIPPKALRQMDEP